MMSRPLTPCGEYTGLGTPVCPGCLNIRGPSQVPLTPVSEETQLSPICDNCWLTSALLQLGRRLQEGDPVLVEANQEHRRLFALLRARVQERITLGEIPPFPPAAFPPDAGEIPPFPPGVLVPPDAGEEAPVLAGLAQRAVRTGPMEVPQYFVNIGQPPLPLARGR